MSDYTPGPWFVFDGGRPGDRPGIELTSEFSIVVFGADDDECGVRGRTPAEESANARLIAAAPDLLEALKALLNNHVELVDSGDCGNWSSAAEAEVIQARAAIAKAEGSAP